jgi:hypothetical protein
VRHGFSVHFLVVLLRYFVQRIGSRHTMGGPIHPKLCRLIYKRRLLGKCSPHRSHDRSYLKDHRLWASGARGHRQDIPESQDKLRALNIPYPVSDITCRCTCVCLTHFTSPFQALGLGLWEILVSQTPKDCNLLDSIARGWVCCMCMTLLRTNSIHMETTKNNANTSLRT